MIIKFCKNEIVGILKEYVLLIVMSSQCRSVVETPGDIVAAHGSNPAG